MNTESPRTDEARLGARDVVIGALVATAAIHLWLVPEHSSERLLGASFAAAAVAAAGTAYLVARGHRLAQVTSLLLLAALLLAYPAVHLVTHEHVEVLDLATKGVEAIGLAASVGLERDEEAPLAAVDVLIGVFVAAMLLSSLGHSHSA